MFTAVPAVTMVIWKRLRCGYNACKLLAKRPWFKLESAHGHFKKVMVCGLENRRVDDGRGQVRDDFMATRGSQC